MEEEEFKKDPFINKDVFKNRRNMAWVSLISAILYPMVFIFGVVPSDIVNFATITSLFYGTVTATILGYLGSTSWTGMKMKEQQSGNSTTESK